MTIVAITLNQPSFESFLSVNPPQLGVLLQSDQHACHVCHGVSVSYEFM